ncbi:cell division cycle-associated protein 2 isoform X2 [Nelusetta ayraudi]|uniref:cell division cycle-associated protein 2 isoform X2 n=1 Tax=Nelusetta ayraudi TaxID=303726 RepID=UPI003F6E7D3F
MDKRFKMASVEGNPGCADGGQKESVTPLEDLPLVLKETTAPLNFCGLTPCHFGISAKSFTPANSSNSKDKSRLAQMKARRRSTIGVRGSPETNSLIRFMAQNRMKTPPPSQTPEPVKSSPFLPRVASTLKQKMASFQYLMDVADDEDCDLAPRQDSDAGGCIKTRDASAHDGEKENRPSASPAARCSARPVAPPEACRLQIREAGAPVLHSSAEKGGLLEDLPPPSEAQAVLIPSPLPPAFKLPACSIPESQQEVDFELESLRQPDGPAAAAAAAPSSHLLGALPSDSEMKPAGADASVADFKAKKKKKSVRFGGPLSPEFFDRHLPPSTPLQKGGTPARAPTPGGALRSALKTPQRSDDDAAAAHPDLDVLSAFGASPVLKMPRNRRMASVGEDEDGQIFQRTIEEMEAEMTADGEYWSDAQPLNLNNAFHEESEAQSLAEAEAEATVDPQTDERTSVPEEPEEPELQQQQLEAKVEPPLRRKPSRKRPAPEGEAPAEAPTRSSSRKRKHLVESEPVKRSKRSSAEAASGKIKSSAVTRRWSKDVDRSLYSSRAYASKNPVLSPITESLSFSTRPPSTSSAGSEVTLEKVRESPSEGEVPTTEASGLLEQEVGDESPECREESTPAERDGETPETVTETRQEVEAGSCDAGTAAAAGRRAGSGGGREAPTSDSGSPALRSPAPRKTKRGRRSSTHRSELKLQVEHQSSCEVEEKKIRVEEEEEKHRRSVSSDSGSQEEWKEAGLAPWQSNFDCEDVFRPVASSGGGEGRRSVRRSLRNRSGVESGGGGGQGLAWLPPSPTDHTAEPRRRTRGRRLSSSQPA